MRCLHEYHSLSARPLTADYGDVRTSAPSSAGVKWQAVPDAPVPAGSPRLRLTQMKALARIFGEDHRSPESESGAAPGAAASHPL